MSFPRDVQPILDRHCVRCHDVPKPSGGVVLSGDVTRTFNVAYNTLNHHNRDWGHSAHPRKTKAIVPVITYVAKPLAPRSTGSIASPLFQKHVLGKHHGVRLSRQEIATLARWVDLNQPYYEDWTSKRYPGGRNLVLSGDLTHVMGRVLGRRCVSCHQKKPLDIIPGLVVNISRPPLSKVLRVPLARDKGGWSAKHKVVFKDRADPEYQAILKAITSERKRFPALCAPATQPKLSGATGRDPTAG